MSAAAAPPPPPPTNADFDVFKGEITGLYTYDAAKKSYIRVDKKSPSNLEQKKDEFCTSPDNVLANAGDQVIAMLGSGSLRVWTKGDTAFSIVEKDEPSVQDKTDPIVQQRLGLLLADYGRDKAEGLPDTDSSQKLTEAYTALGDLANLDAAKQKAAADADAAQKADAVRLSAANAPQAAPQGPPPPPAAPHSGPLGTDLENKEAYLPEIKDETHYNYYGTENMLLQVLVAMFDFFVSWPFQFVAMAALRVVAPVVSEVRGAWNFGWGVALSPFFTKWSRDLRERGRELSGTLPLVGNLIEYPFHATVGRLLDGLGWRDSEGHPYFKTRRDYVLNTEWRANFKNSAVCKAADLAGPWIGDSIASTGIYTAKILGNSMAGFGNLALGAVTFNAFGNLGSAGNHFVSAGRNAVDFIFKDPDNEDQDPGLWYKLREFGWDMGGQGPLAILGSTCRMSKGVRTTLLGGYEKDKNGNIVIKRPLNTLGILPTWYGTHDLQKLQTLLTPLGLHDTFYHPDRENKPKATFNATNYWGNVIWGALPELGGWIRRIFKQGGGQPGPVPPNVMRNAVNQQGFLPGGARLARETPGPNVAANVGTSRAAVADRSSARVVPTPPGLLATDAAAVVAPKRPTETRFPAQPDSWNMPQRPTGASQRTDKKIGRMASLGLYVAKSLIPGYSSYIARRDGVLSGTLMREASGGVSPSSPTIPPSNNSATVTPE